MVKSRFVAVLALAALVTSAAAFADGAADGPADVAVLLDVSQSVLPYFHDVTDYVVSSVARDYVRLGDSFHLLSFGSGARVEISQVMSDESDVKSVLGRLYLLYPLDTRSDFAASLDFLYGYLSSLPQDRPKVVVVITDGIHNPPPSSPSYDLGHEEVAAAIEASASRIRAKGWPVHIIKLPFPEAGDRGAAGGQASDANGRSYIDVAAKALGSTVSDFQDGDKAGIAARALGAATAEFPPHLGKRDYSFSFPLRIANGSDSRISLELERAVVEGYDVLERPASISIPAGASGVLNVPIVLPESLGEGEKSLGIRLSFAGGARVSPREGTLSLTLERSALGGLLRSNARIIILAAIIVLAAAAIVATIVILRGAGGRARGPLAAAVLGGEAKARDASMLRGAAARTEADRRARLSAAEDAAAGLARERREAAQRDAELLASAAGERQALASKGSDRPGSARKRGAPAISVQEQDRRDREQSAQEAAEAIAAERRAESERSAALLAAALPRHAPQPTAAVSARGGAAAFEYESRVVKPGQTRVELRVEEQNPHIGLRNVHVLHAGAKKTVGGGASDFLVFLVSVPRHAADLHFDGEKLAFVPRRPELFPELSGPLEDCLGVDIAMISSSGYPLTLRFVAYEEPAKTINRLLHCIDVPGLF